MPELRILLLQIVVVCSVSRGMGWLFGKMRQPRVVGEIVAGVLLGPSLLGWIAPSALAFLFPAQWLGPLYSALNENLDKCASYAALWKATNSVLVAAKRCAFSSR